MKSAALLSLASFGREPCVNVSTPSSGTLPAWLAEKPADKDLRAIRLVSTARRRQLTLRRPLIFPLCAKLSGGNSGDKSVSRDVSEGTP